jgi:hypothetical protein
MKADGVLAVYFGGWLVGTMLTMFWWGYKGLPKDVLLAVLICSFWPILIPVLLIDVIVRRLQK